MCACVSLTMLTYARLDLILTAILSYDIIVSTFRAVEACPVHSTYHTWPVVTDETHGAESNKLVYVMGKPHPSMYCLFCTLPLLAYLCSIVPYRNSTRYAVDRDGSFLLDRVHVDLVYVRSSVLYTFSAPKVQPKKSRPALTIYGTM